MLEVQYFKTALLYFKSLINRFDILAISEHCLFEEQLGMFETATDSSYNDHAVSANDNPAILSGERAHGSVALIWNHKIDNFITPIDTIESDRIVGIKCEFVNCGPLFILAVYLPSANHALEEFKECFDYVWALYDSLSADGFVILLGDYNGGLGSSLGDKGKKGPNDCGLLLLDFANFFNICPINLLRRCKGPLESYNYHCGRYHSTLDYIFLPNCLLNNIYSAETFELDVDNTSDHLPILVNLRISKKIPTALNLDSQSDSGSGVKQKVHWSNFSHGTVTEKYVTPLLADLVDLDLNEWNETDTVSNTITKLLLKHSYPLFSPGSNHNRKHKHGVYVKAERSQCKTAFDY